MSDKPRAPKRGAFPTPKDILERATPFIPEASPKTSDQPNGKQSRSPERKEGESADDRASDQENDSKRK